MERDKTKRTAMKSVINNLITKLKSLNLDDEQNNRELLSTIKVIELKMSQIEVLNEKILDEISMEDMELDIEVSTKFEIDVNTELEKFRRTTNTNNSDLSSTTVDAVTAANPIIAMNNSETTDPRNVVKTGVKLPKIFIKRYNGDPLQWQQFYDTFKATIMENTSLSKVEKFTYLRSYLTGDAERCIQGITLREDNFDSAMDLLKERYGLPQICIASHMDKLVKLKKLNHANSVKDLRNMYDSIENHLRSLVSLGINSEQFGSMLAPIIIEKIPHEIRLIVTRKLGKENWKIEELMENLKFEIEARESCEVNSNNGSNVKDEFSNAYSNRKTTQSLFNSECHNTVKCVF